MEMDNHTEVMDSKEAVVTTTPDVDSEWPTDALDALKQDPAVLKAQIRLNKSDAPSPEQEKNLVYQKHGEHSESIANVPEAGGSQQFEDTMRLQKVAVLSLAPAQLGMLLKYAGVLRLQRHFTQEQVQECAFCKKNGESRAWYSSHKLKDNRGHVRCPVLREYRCPICEATGDRAHTFKYCPLNRCGIRWDS